MSSGTTPQARESHATTLLTCGSACLVAALALLDSRRVLGWVLIALSIGVTLWGVALMGTVTRRRGEAAGGE